MASAPEDHDRSFQIAERALELMRVYGSSASPKSYEVWYTYVTGQKPVINDAIKRLAAETGEVSDADIEALYDQHMAHQRIAHAAERTSATVVTEIDHVMRLVDEALGSTARYGESLEAFSTGLAGPIDRARVRELVAAIVSATRQVEGTNRTLETRLKETRGEIEQLRESLESVRVESLTDTLTGVANRKAFEEALTTAVGEAAATRAPLALIVLDIDHFKRFNDTYGHLTGDQVLRLVSVTMREQVRMEATLARFGGEEFAVVLPGATLEGARGVAERIRQSVMARELVKRSTGESLGKVTVSVGVAAGRPDDTAVSLLDRADQCMYAAKRSGRNRTVTEAEYLQAGESGLSAVA